MHIIVSIYLQLEKAYLKSIKLLFYLYLKIQLKVTGHYLSFRQNELMSVTLIIFYKCHNDELFFTTCI